MNKLPDIGTPEGKKFLDDSWKKYSEEGNPRITEEEYKKPVINFITRAR